MNDATIDAVIAKEKESAAKAERKLKILTAKDRQAPLEKSHPIPHPTTHNRVRIGGTG
jgi:septum formation topological specificity factor MinE